MAGSGCGRVGGSRPARERSERLGRQRNFHPHADGWRLPDQDGGGAEMVRRRGQDRQRHQRRPDGGHRPQPPRLDARGRELRGRAGRRGPQHHKPLLQK